MRKTIFTDHRDPVHFDLIVEDSVLPLTNACSTKEVQSRVLAQNPLAWVDLLVKARFGKHIGMAFLRARSFDTEDQIIRDEYHDLAYEALADLSARLLEAHDAYLRLHSSPALVR